MSILKFHSRVQREIIKQNRDLIRILPTKSDDYLTNMAFYGQTYGYNALDESTGLFITVNQENAFIVKEYIEELKQKKLWGTRKEVVKEIPNNVFYL